LRPFKETHAQGDRLRREQGESSLAARLKRARRGRRERETVGTGQERELAKRMWTLSGGSWRFKS